MTNCEILRGNTKDNLELIGFHFEPKFKKNICVVCIHGMSGNFLENIFGEVLGKELSSKNIGFIYTYNRGYNFINDIKINKINKIDNSFFRKKIGVVYERFEESIYDLDMWIKKAKQLGYKKIILMGYSLGSNKSIYYLHKTKNKENINGLILASPPDLVGLAKLEKPNSNYIGLLNEAKKNCSNNEPNKILKNKLWNYYTLSSQTFLDLFQENSLADNLPILRNPSKFNQLSKIKIPIFVVAGEYDDIVIRNLKEDLELIKEKSISCPKFEIKIIKGANHCYETKEKDLRKSILNWINKLLF